MTLVILEARADPPQSPYFARANVLAERLAQRLAELQRKKEFEAKPRAEKLLIRFAAGAETFEGETLTGSLVLEEVMKAGPAEGVRLRSDLVRAFKKRYGFIFTKSKTLKRQRYLAGRLLVDALTDREFEIRRLAIDCLEAMYATRRGYHPEAPESDRRRKQRDWRRNLPK